MIAAAGETVFATTRHGRLYTFARNDDTKAVTSSFTRIAALGGEDSNSAQSHIGW